MRSPPAPEVVAALDRLKSLFPGEKKPVAELGPAAARDRNRAEWAGFWSAGGPEVDQERDAVVQTEAGPVAVRYFFPSAAVLGPIFYFHGGGFVVGDLDTHAGTTRRLALYSGHPVVAIHYRRSPEFPYPFPLDDCVGVVNSFLSGHLGSEISSSEYALCGDSAGASLALDTARVLRERGLRPAGAISLLYGCFDPEMRAASFNTYGDGAYYLASNDVAWFWRQYLTTSSGAAVDYAGPLTADLSDLPPTRLDAAECDPLVDDSRRLAARLTKAGVSSELVVRPGMIHGFAGMAREIHEGERALTEISAWLSAHLHGK